MHYYKVVDEDLRSCCKNDFFPEEYRVQYIVGEFVKPSVDETCLYVFKEFVNAKDFINNAFIDGPYWKIYRCEVTNPLRASSLAYPESIHRFWKGQYVEYETYPAPKGTYRCDSVKLIEKVEDI